MRILFVTGFFLLTLSACTSHNSYNIIDITDNQWIENAKGERCIEKQMTINPDSIVYLYENCPIRRIVCPKPHILPKP